MDKAQIAKRIWDICQEEKGLKDEKEELRADLFNRMNTNEIVYFDTPVGVHRASKKPSKEVILKTNSEIFEIIGDKYFIQAAKLSMSGLNEVCGEAMALNCIAVTGFNDTLKILKGRG